MTLTSVAKKIFLDTLESLRDAWLEVVCPQQSYSFGDPGAKLRGLVVIHDERVFRRALLAGEIGLGEGYMAGEWSSPDVASVVRALLRNLRLLEEKNRLLSRFSGWLETLRHRLQSNSILGSRRNIAYHYDLGNEFYRLFLDENMAYSCAYFARPEESLGPAQIGKFERICRKLRLGPQDHLLEIGTGWGGFAVHAAKHYGCRVTTTTISRQQYDYAAGWFARERLQGQIELRFDDYRHLNGQFDKIVSIEMFEAVGFEHYDAFFGACDRLLKPQGAMLLQTITLPEQRVKDYRRRRDWIQKYIFPGSELASLGEIVRSTARATRLALYHAEDIGMHYARTLQLWRERFLAALGEVQRLGYDERFVRMWDFYLASCEAAFRERVIADFQLLLTKTFNRAALGEEPWTLEESEPSPAMALPLA